MRQKLKSVVKKSDTQASLASERGISQQAVSKRLAKAESMAAQLQAEKLRKWKAEADLLEIETAEAEGRLLTPEVVQERINKAIGILRQYLIAGEAELPRLMNPTDPEAARREFSKWLMKFWPLMRERQND